MTEESPYRYAIWWESGALEGVVDPVGFAAPLTADQYPTIAPLLAERLGVLENPLAGGSLTIVRHQASAA
jgi:hypothetical protein